jgi:hypothetical protein
MTSDQLTKFKEYLLIVAAILGICASMWWMISWFTGGLKPGDQVVTESLSDKVTAIQLSVSTLSNQMSAMPRPTDYQSLENHLESIDRSIGLLGDRLTQDEISAARTSATIGNIGNAVNSLQQPGSRQQQGR